MHFAVSGRVCYHLSHVELPWSLLTAQVQPPQEAQPGSVAASLLIPSPDPV